MGARRGVLLHFYELLAAELMALGAAAFLLPRHFAEGCLYC
jgi:hypothetical protein